MRFLEIVLLISMFLSMIASGSLALSFIAWLVALIFAPLQANIFVLVMIISFLALVIFLGITLCAMIIALGEQND